MPIDVTYDPQKNILIVTAIGQIELHEIASVFEQITGSNDYSPSIDAVWDLRQADFSSADDEMCCSIITLRKQHSSRAGNKVALVASDDLAYGMSRMYAAFSENELPRTLKVFRDYSEAEDWVLCNSS